MKNILLISLLLLCSWSMSAQSGDVQSLKQSLSELIDAMLAQDTDKLDEITADDLHWGHTGGKLDLKAGYLDMMSSKTFKYVKFEPKDQNIRFYGDVAILRCDVAGAVFYNGDTEDFTLNMVTVWHKKDDKWLLVDRQASEKPVGKE